MKTKKALSFICFVSLLFSLSIPVSANSRAQIWEGTDANGVIFKDGDVPIKVESELLTFDIPTLPYVSYRDAESFLAYDSKVTAEYTFYNPTDMTVTATLLFPFGSYPEYALLYDSETEKHLYAEDLERYGVYVNGEKIDAKLRHTDYRFDKKFDINDHIDFFSNEYIIDEFYRPDLTVTKYSYEIVGHSLPSAHFDINIDSIGSERVMMIYQGNAGSYITDSGGFVVSNNGAKSGEKLTVSFYVLGAPLSETPTAGWYKNNGNSPDTKIDGEFKYLGSESTTLESFIFKTYSEEKGVSQVDWYNSCIANLKRSVEKRGTASAIRHVTFGALMRWFEYEITFAPGEKIKNSVTTPMYPQIEAWNQPYKYIYTYLLSPASNWADFGKLDIVINTSYEMSFSNLEGFEKTETGYKLSRDGLPTNEGTYLDLHFTLLGDGTTPKEQPNPNLFLRILEGIGSFIGALLTTILMGILLLIDFIRRLFVG
jgi:hypothetical protein